VLMCVQGSVLYVNYQESKRTKNKVGKGKGKVIIGMCKREWKRSTME